MRSDTKSWPDRERAPIRNNAGAVFSRGEAISLVTRIACRKVIKTGWPRSREVAMVISRQGRTYTLNGHERHRDLYHVLRKQPSATVRRARTDARAHHWHVPPTPSPTLSKLLFLLVRPIKRAPRHLSRRIRARMPGTKRGYVVFLPICNRPVIDIGSDRAWPGLRKFR